MAKRRTSGVSKKDRRRANKESKRLKAAESARLATKKPLVEEHPEDAHLDAETRKFRQRARLLLNPEILEKAGFTTAQLQEVGKKAQIGITQAELKAQIKQALGKKLDFEGSKSSWNKLRRAVRGLVEEALREKASESPSASPSHKKEKKVKRKSQLPIVENAYEKGSIIFLDGIRAMTVDGISGDRSGSGWYATVFPCDEEGHYDRYDESQAEYISPDHEEGPTITLEPTGKPIYKKSSAPAREEAPVEETPVDPVFEAAVASAKAATALLRGRAQMSDKANVKAAKRCVDAVLALAPEDETWLGYAAAIQEQEEHIAELEALWMEKPIRSITPETDTNVRRAFFEGLIPRQCLLSIDGGFLDTFLNCALSKEEEYGPLSGKMTVRESGGQTRIVDISHCDTITCFEKTAPGIANDIEPSPNGEHDEMILDLLQHFTAPVTVIIDGVEFDLNQIHDFRAFSDERAIVIFLAIKDGKHAHLNARQHHIRLQTNPSDQSLRKPLTIADIKRLEPGTVIYEWGRSEKASKFWEFTNRDQGILVGGNKKAEANDRTFGVTFFTACPELEASEELQQEYLPQGSHHQETQRFFNQLNPGDELNASGMKLTYCGTKIYSNERGVWFLAEVRLEDGTEVSVSSFSYWWKKATAGEELIKPLAKADLEQLESGTTLFADGWDEVILDEWNPNSNTVIASDKLNPRFEYPVSDTLFTLEKIER